MGLQTKTKKAKSAKVSNVNPLNISIVLGTLNRDELRALATHLNVPRGKDKENTIANIKTAVANGTAHVKTIVYISTPPSPADAAANPYAKGNTLFVKKFRNYKADKVMTPVPPVVVS